MHRVFNCGIGMVIVLSAQQAPIAIEELRKLGEQVYELGTIVSRPAGEHQTIVV